MLVLGVGFVVAVVVSRSCLLLSLVVFACCNRLRGFFPSLPLASQRQYLPNLGAVHGRRAAFAPKQAGEENATPHVLARSCDATLRVFVL